MDAVPIIKSSVSVPDAFSMYGFRPDAKGFALCPFHAEKTPSCKVFNDHFYCFGCGAHGDVIALVEGLFDLPFKDAVKRLDSDFHLGLYTDSPLVAKTRGRAVYEQNRKRRDLQLELDAADNAYWELFDTVKRLTAIRDAHTPQSPTDQLDPLYIMSCKYLEGYTDDLERADIHRKEVMQRWNELN